MKCIDIFTWQTSALTPSIHQTNREREEKRNEIDFCLFVVFLQPWRAAWIVREAVSDLSGVKLMLKIVSAPEGYRQTTDN